MACLETPTPNPSPPRGGERAAGATISPYQQRGTVSVALFGGERFRLQRQTEAFPNLQQGLGQMVDQRVLVVGRGRDSEPLGAFGHRRVVDRLDVDAVLFEQDIAGLLAAFRV